MLHLHHIGETEKYLSILNLLLTIAYVYADISWKDKLTSYDGKDITYDNIGNPTKYNGWAFTWEQGRQLSGMSKTGMDVSFKYNDSGIRTQKTVNGVTTNYYLDGDKVTYEDNGTDKIYYTYDASGNLVSMNLNGVEYYYIRNGQGDITSIMDSNGMQVVSYTYDTWGKLISIKDKNGADVTNDTTNVGYKNQYRYRGYRYDSETGLYCLQSRYYNPEWGRFINADDIDILSADGELLGNNLFAYCTNDPVNNSDDSGYWKLPNWAKVAIDVVASGIGAAVTAITGGAAAPALLGALQIAGSSAAIGAGTEAVSGYISGGRKGVLRGAIDGATDGFMWGGVGAAVETVSAKVASKVIFNGNKGRGFKIGKKAEVLYKNPNKGGGTLVLVKKTKFRIDLDPVDGLHGHWGTGKAAKRIHRSLAPWNFGKPKKFW